MISQARPVVDQAQPEIKVLRVAKIFVEQSDLEYWLATRYHAGCIHTLFIANQAEKSYRTCAGRRGHQDFHHGSAGKRRVAKVSRVRANQIAIVFLNEFELFVQIIRQPKIVGVQESNEFSAGRSQSGITRRASAAILMFEVADAISVGFERAFKIVTIGRAVVYDNDFEVGKCLREDRLERL